MAAETYLTIKLILSIISLVMHLEESIKINLIILIGALQIISYLVSPYVCYQKGLAVKNDLETIENQWKNAEILKKCNQGFYEAGQILWWGLPGLILFAPFVWKWKWAGKTVLENNQVQIFFFLRN